MYVYALKAAVEHLFTHNMFSSFVSDFPSPPLHALGTYYSPTPTSSPRIDLALFFEKPVLAPLYNNVIFFISQELYLSLCFWPLHSKYFFFFLSLISHNFNDDTFRTRFLVSGNTSPLALFYKLELIILVGFLLELQTRVDASGGLFTLILL